VSAEKVSKAAHSKTYYHPGLHKYCRQIHSANTYLQSDKIYIRRCRRFPDSSSDTV